MFAIHLACGTSYLTILFFLPPYRKWFFILLYLFIIPFCDQPLQTCSGVLILVSFLQLLDSLPYNWLSTPHAILQHYRSFCTGRCQISQYAQGSYFRDKCRSMNFGSTEVIPQKEGKRKVVIDLLLSIMSKTGMPLYRCKNWKGFIIIL